MKPATDTHTLSGCLFSHVLICFFIGGVSRALLMAKPEKVLLFVAEFVAEQGGMVHGAAGLDCVVTGGNAVELEDPLPWLFDGGAVAEIVKVTSLVLFR